MTTGDRTRRAFIGAGVATVAAAALAPARTFAATETVATYALDPTGGGERCVSNCATCSACRHHLANKLFRTERAADAGRAHAGCRCAVVSGQPLSRAVFTSIFEDGDTADRRHSRTSSLLAAEVEQHSVPMFSGVIPITVAAGGAAGILWMTRRRQHPPPA